MIPSLPSKQGETRRQGGPQYSISPFAYSDPSVRPSLPPCLSSPTLSNKFSRCPSEAELPMPCHPASHSPTKPDVADAGGLCGGRSHANSTPIRQTRERAKLAARPIVRGSRLVISTAANASGAAQLEGVSAEIQYRNSGRRGDEMRRAHMTRTSPASWSRSLMHRYREGTSYTCLGQINKSRARACAGCNTTPSPFIGSNKRNSVSLPLAPPP